MRTFEFVVANPHTFNLRGREGKPALRYSAPIWMCRFTVLFNLNTTPLLFFQLQQNSATQYRTSRVNHEQYRRKTDKLTLSARWVRLQNSTTLASKLSVFVPFRFDAQRDKPTALAPTKRIDQSTQESACYCRVGSLAREMRQVKAAIVAAQTFSRRRQYERKALLLNHEEHGAQPKHQRLVRWYQVLGSLKGSNDTDMLDDKPLVPCALICFTPSA